MMSKAAKVTVKAWQFGTSLLERYTYAPGCVEPIPKHSHAEYQFALCLDWQGEYNYRGAWHQIPERSLSIIHPGEMHTPSEKTVVPVPANYWMMITPPEVLQVVASEIMGRSAELPFFAEPFFLNANITQAYSHLHCLVEQSATQLEQEFALLSLLNQLIIHYAQDRPTVEPLKPARPAVVRVQEFLHAHFAENISLEQLTEVAQLSRFHLCRVFRCEIGIAPHRYQMQVRVDYAKHLLNQGKSVSEVAALTGFYDQSHFGQHFKRLTGVTPACYLSQRNNILDKP